MGIIKEDVRENYLAENTDKKQLLNIFAINGFDITWAKKLFISNTTIHACFLKPEAHIQESFGFDNELLLIISEYDKMEPRTIQAVENIISNYPANGRVDNLTYILVSSDPTVEEWVRKYKSGNNDPRIIIPFYSRDLYMNVANAWYIRNELGYLFFGRDLFENTLPLTKDQYFFGRQHLLASYYDAIKRLENKGLFGLRKTGKTSFLFKLKRMMEVDDWGVALYLDCKLPHIRKMNSNELLLYIVEMIKKDLHLITENSTLIENGDRVFYEFFHSKELKARKKHIVLLFDEIEYISFYAKLNKQWNNEYIDFWQTIWSAQSDANTFSFIITGVNANVVEESLVNGVQNPLFGIVRYEYLKGFEFDDVKIMLNKLGRRMGMEFDAESLNYVFARYGGHPLLTRMACSLTHKKLQFVKVSRPYEITKKYLELDEMQREEELSYYCGHVVSELNEFYPDEYDVLEYLACGMLTDFNDLAQNSAFIKHLNSYGLITKSTSGIPQIAIPVLGAYIAKQIALKEKRSTYLRIIEKEERELWIDRRKELILESIKSLEKLIEDANAPKLFGCNSFNDADKFAKVKVVFDKDSYGVFINVVFKCFCESIENYGKSIGKKNYLTNDIKSTYPAFFETLDKINVYRNDQDHLLLNQSTSERIKKYLRKDFFGQPITSYEEPYFALQQKCLDDLLGTIQIEIARLS